MRIGIKTILSVLVSLATLLPSAAQKNHNFEVGKNLDVFNNLFKQLDLYYVDTINPAKLIKEATDAMLSTLDPYTNYFADNERSDLKQMLTGKYGGMGALIHYNKELKRCVIAEPFENCPATKAGLRAGDVILEAKTTALAKHYEKDFGAILLPTFQSSAPRYLIADDAAKQIFLTYLSE